LSLWALATTVVALQACGSNGDQPPSLGPTEGTDASIPNQCNPGNAGCPCDTEGETVACGDVVTKNGSYVTCSMGESTCKNGTWGACNGNKIVMKSVSRLSLREDWVDYGVEFPDAGVACPNVCDPNPNCTSLPGNPGYVDAGGIYPGPEGGLTLGNGEAGSSGPCTGLQCYVAQCSGGTTSTLSGTVTDPAGQVPMYSATVYIPVDPTGVIPAFTTGVTCDQCAGAVPPDAVASTTTDVNGNFTLSGIPTGSGLLVPVVVQMGKWRREILLSGLSSCTNNVMTTNCTATDKTMCAFRLPKNQHDGYDPADASYDHADMPQMAMVTGSADPLECILLKAGISESEFSSYNGTNSVPAAHVHMFESNNAPGAYLDPALGQKIENASTLWRDTSPTTVAAPHYNYYDVVLDACEGSAIDKHTVGGGTPTNNQAGEPYYDLQQYVNGGGRAFLTHYSYVWLQYGSAKNYVAGPNNWNGLVNWLGTPWTGTYATQDPLTANVITNFPKGAAYEQWLFNVGASTVLDQLTIHEGRQDLYNPSGAASPLTSPPSSGFAAGVQPWLNASDQAESSSKRAYIPHFTFNTPLNASAANQCGRVVFSDFHVSANSLVANNPNATCTEDSQCGFGQTCTGHPGMSGTCSEPCTTNADCHDSTYSCMGATAGQCLPTSCTAGTPTYSCPGGLTCDTATHTNCLCTADNQCPSGKCINEGQCGAGPCTGSGAPDPSTDCQPDVATACPGTTTYTCSDPKFTCTTASGTCPGVTTGNALTTCTQPPNTCTSGVPNPIAAGGHAVGSECWCNSDSECPSLKCINNGQTGCTGATCTGSGTLDPVTGCQADANTSCNASYGCSDSHYSSSCTAASVGASCPGLTKSSVAEVACTTSVASCSSGVLNTVAVTGYGVDATCWCTSDSQCPSRHCYNNPSQHQCTGTCTGTAGTSATFYQTMCDDDANVSCSTSYSCSDNKYSSSCVANGVACPGATPGTAPAEQFNCTAGTPNASSIPSICYCTNDNQCGGGRCVPATAAQTYNGMVSCSSPNCTGVSGQAGTTTDAHNCQFYNESFSSPSGGGTYACPGDTTRNNNNGNGFDPDPLGCNGSHNCNNASHGDQCLESGSHTGSCTKDGIGCCEDGTLGGARTSSPYLGQGSCSSGQVCDYLSDSGHDYCACSSSAQCGDYGVCDTPPPLTSSQFHNDDWFNCEPRPQTTCNNLGSACAGGGTCEPNFASGGNWFFCCDGYWHLNNCNGVGSANQCGGGNYPTCLNYSGGNYCVAASGTCECTNDTQCGTGSKCNNDWNQCSGNNCTGNSRYADKFDCTVRSATGCTPPTALGCSPGTYNSSTGKCICSADNQCNSGSCDKSNPGCSGGSCTGTSGQGGADGCVNSCTETLGACTPGTANAANTTCLCTNNNQCQSGLCVATTVNGTATCTSPNCTGSAAATVDAHQCVVTTAETVSSGPAETCSNGVPPQGSGSYTDDCWCTNDNQCPTGVCVYWSGCANNTVCSGTGGTFTAASHCATAAPTCSGSSSCSLAGSTTCSGGLCKCGADSDCPSGQQCGSVHGISTGLDDLGCVNPAPLTYTGPGTPACPAGGTCNTGTNQCQCNNDNQCPSGACVCGSGSCTGVAPADSHGCQIATPTCNPAAYSCPLLVGGAVPSCDATTHNCKCNSDLECPGSQCGSLHGISTGLDDLGCVLPATLPPVTVPPETCPAGGACNTGTNQCWCTNDNQCPTGACVNQGQAGCTAGTCTGTGTADAHSCAPTTPTCSGNTTYACPATTQGTCNGANNCICNADSQCGTGGKCVNVGQTGCTSGTCTGTGAANDRGCQDPAQTLPVGCTKTIPYSCNQGVCNAAGTTCLCTADSQCPSGLCVDGGQGCAAGACTGTGTPDNSQCVPSTVTNCTSPPPPNGNNAQCGGVNSVEQCSTVGDSGGGPGLGQCQKACTTNAQCGGGEICTGGYCQGCNSSAQCYDRVYPKSCNGAVGSLTGKCCGNGSPIPTTTCGTTNSLFPEECLQTPLTDQEKALEFMFFDLTSCVTPDTAPTNPPVLLTEKSFTLEFAASCPMGSRPRWREFDYEASFPPNATGTYTATYPDNSIDFAAQTGGGLPNVNDAGGPFIPTTPLQLGAPDTTNMLPPNWTQILLDTAPGGTGYFTTATPPIDSQTDLLMTITLTPTADQLSSPTLLNWRAIYDCPASE
jgi:hypothetical protein